MKVLIACESCSYGKTGKIPLGENNQVNAHGAASVRAGRPMRIGVDFL